MSARPTVPSYLTRRERELSGMTTVKLSRATRALIAQMQGLTNYRPRTVDQVVYDLAAAALDANGSLGPAEREKIEAPFRSVRSRYTAGSASIPPIAAASASVPAIASIPAAVTAHLVASIPRRPKRPAAE